MNEENPVPNSQEGAPTPPPPPPAPARAPEPSPVDNVVSSVTDAFSPDKPKDRTVAGILAILLGGLGIHKFYLGQTTPGLIMLVASVGLSAISFGLLSWVLPTMGIVEGILYLTKSDAEFQQMYVVEKKAWF